VGETFGPAIAALLVEEVAKGFALVIAFCLSWWAARRFGFLEFEELTDGIVYGAAVGLGFAFTEDLLSRYSVAEPKGQPSRAPPAVERGSLESERFLSPVKKRDYHGVCGFRVRSHGRAVRQDRSLSKRRVPPALKLSAKVIVSRHTSRPSGILNASPISPSAGGFPRLGVVADLDPCR
jgi:hypothetical protein